jgi:hypothetical protein
MPMEGEAGNEVNEAAAGSKERRRIDGWFQKESGRERNMSLNPPDWLGPKPAVEQDWRKSSPDILVSKAMHHPVWPKAIIRRRRPI